MLTRAGYVLLGSALALLTSGAGLGNLYYASLALIPLGVLLVASALDGPHSVRATLTLSKTGPRVGDEVLVEVAYEIPRGFGPLELHVPVPEAFELLSGSNLRVLRKPFGKPVSGRMSFTVRAGKRGRHEIGPVQAESVHPAGLRAPQRGAVAEAIPIEVRPPQSGVRRVRGLPGLAKQLFPENDAANTGIRTTEFREIREFRQGDPIKYINWKATSRRVGFTSGIQQPLVNEYEREGKKSVWLFLDAAPYMQVGTTVENSFEHAIAAANGVASFYLGRGYRLGCTVYNHGDDLSLYPDTGKRQQFRVRKLLTTLEPGRAPPEGLLAAVDRSRGWLQAEKPLVVVVTRLGKADERTFEAIKRLRALTGRRRRRIPVLVVTLVAHAAIPAKRDYDKDLVELLRRKDRPLLVRARRMGARVLEWNASEVPLESLLLRGGGRRG